MWSVIVVFTSLLGGPTAQPDYYYHHINVDDILRPDLMPANLLLVEGPELYEAGLSARGGDIDLEPEAIVDASVENALATMTYHRKKINEYFCNNFVAADLIGALMSKPVTSLSRKVDATAFLGPAQMMLFDEGSKSYKSWLARNDLNFGHDSLPRENFTDSNYLDDAGPLFQNQVPITKRIMNSPPEELENTTGLIPADSKVGYGGYYDVPRPIVYSVAPTQHVESHDSGAFFKSLEINDLFEIVMTTLAFMSFGTFALQVIMCLATTESTFGNMMGAGGGGGVDSGFGETEEPTFVHDEPSYDLDEGYYPNNGGEVEVRTRRKRNIVLSDRVIDVNDIARRVLKSIDAVVLANEDKAKCLRHTLCEMHKFSRSRKDSQKYWIPVWGLGITWLSSRLIEFQSTSTSVLDGLKASVIGLGDGDCGQQFRADSCGRSFLQLKRRRRR